MVEVRCSKVLATIGVITLVLALLSCLICYYVVSGTVASKASTLRLVIVFFRHGARTPTRPYSSDPYQDLSKWPDGWGALTKNGKIQLYELGKKYRNYYANFIPEEYYEKDVYVRSSDKSRCLMSAYTFLAGLYPPTERQMWHPEIGWQPIPVHSLPRDLDDLVTGTKPCKLYKDMYFDLLNKTSSHSNWTELYEYLTEKMNETVSDVMDLNYIYSTLSAQHEEGFKLPIWTETVFPDKLHSPYMLSLALFSYNETMQRLRVGPLLKKFKEYFENYINNGNDSRNFYVYSGHDINVVSLWRALGFKELVDPQYGASLTFELHHDIEEETFFVQIFFRNNTKIEIPTEARIPHCCCPCRYKDFIAHIDGLIPKDWNNECQN